MRWHVLIITLARRSGIDLRRYYLNTIGVIISIYLMFLLIFLLTHSLSGGLGGFGGTIDRLVVGFLMFSLAASSYSELAWELAGEARQGTLEQLAMSPFGLVNILLVRLEVGLFYQLIVNAAFLCLMMLTTGQWLNLDVVSIAPLLFLTILGVQGIGFAIGGLALIFKQIQSVFQLLQFGFIALTTVPVDTYGFLQYLPLAWGTHLIKRVMVQGDSIGTIGMANILFLIVHSISYLCGGIILFKCCERYAKGKGLLGHY